MLAIRIQTKKSPYFFAPHSRRQLWIMRLTYYLIPIAVDRFNTTIGLGFAVGFTYLNKFEKTLVLI